MYRTILVPLDGSKRAEAILPHVEQLAHHFEARVIFLQVVEPRTPPVMPEGMLLNLDQIQQDFKEVDTYLAAKQGEFREMGIEARHTVEYGPVVQKIIDVAEREGADLIAMASHGRSGMSRVFYGSVAAGVLQRVDRPLLLIRSRRD
ncbi:MAG: universal stress protein [Chloroflexi bacterium]|nr:universal stress protein [Chloroflexota bacterium]MCI0581232.1 universal stress protein [Chloroflexota bacterium]MCI0646909.1 universal stress protein [Chloroflexota bacterium]MCI0731638.1 universal stress protein [Chloroflexota bacterium]